MTLSKDVVHHLQTLARLKLPQDQEDRLLQELDSILQHVQALNAVDVSSVVPMTHAVPASLHLREDQVCSGVGVEGLHSSAGRDGPYVRVPKIIE